MVAEEDSQAEAHLEIGNMLKLKQDEISKIENQIKDFEFKTGTELLLVLTNQSDPYPGASLRFGFIVTFLVLLMTSYYIEFTHQFLWPVMFFITFLFFTWLGHFPFFKKMALSHLEMKRECKEKALEYFHTLGTNQVTHKTTVMIMISLLEKKIEVLIDEKIKEKIHQQDLDELIQVMSHHFKKSNFHEGISLSIEELERKILKSFSGKVLDSTSDLLSNTIHFKLN